jgi:hypothetical protein
MLFWVTGEYCPLFFIFTVWYVYFYTTATIYM